MYQWAVLGRTITATGRYVKAKKIWWDVSNNHCDSLWNRLFHIVSRGPAGMCYELNVCVPEDSYAEIPIPSAAIFAGIEERRGDKGGVLIQWINVFVRRDAWELPFRLHAQKEEVMCVPSEMGATDKPRERPENEASFAGTLISDFQPQEMCKLDCLKLGLARKLWDGKWKD